MKIKYNLSKLRDEPKQSFERKFIALNVTLKEKSLKVII